MNIFMPERTIYESVKALDDKRLIKQILECKTILDVAFDETKKGYARHPVVVYYKDYPMFVACYGLFACMEYNHRFDKVHNAHRNFWIVYDSLKVQLYGLEFGEKIIEPCVKHFYCEGAKTDPNCIRTTENTVELFRNKLCKKWDNDKYPPKWTNRQPPKWYNKK